MSNADLAFVCLLIAAIFTAIGVGIGARSSRKEVERFRQAAISSQARVEQIGASLRQAIREVGELKNDRARCWRSEAELDEELERVARGRIRATS